MLTLKSKPGVIALKWKSPKSPPTVGWANKMDTLQSTENHKSSYAQQPGWTSHSLMSFRYSLKAGKTKIHFQGAHIDGKALKKNQEMAITKL